MREYYITKNDSGQRLNKFLEKAVPRLSGGMMHKYLRLKRIKLNGKRTEAACRLAEGDRVQLYINDEYFEQVREEEAFRRIKTPRLTVVYEDENILLADKAPGMVVHADEKGDSDTLIAHIQAYLYQSGAWNPDDAASFAPALCNRIDRNTGGIVIAAKTAEALRILNDKIKEHELKKKYLCVVLGRPSPPKGRIENFLRRDEKRKQVTLHDRPVPGRQDRKDPLPHTRLHEGALARRVRPAHRPHPSDPRPHGLDRLSAARRRQVRPRRPQPRLRRDRSAALFV